MEEKDEIIISPRIILEALRRGLVFMIVVTLVCGIGAFVYTKVFVQKRYTSSMSLYVETNYTSKDDDDEWTKQQQLTQTINENTLARRMVATCVKLLNTNTFYTTLAENLNNDYTPGQLKSMISYPTDDEDTTEIFSVVVSSPSPRESKRIADEFAKAAPARIKEMNSRITLKLADPGQIPTYASYPSTAKNVFFAAGIGLLVSLIIVFIRYFADKKIKYSDEMTEIYELPILAAIPNFDSYIQKSGDAQKKKKS